MNKFRTIRKEILFSPQEFETVKLRFEKSGCSNINEYIRIMALKQVIVQYNPELQRKTMSLMSNIANNMNQLAIRVNEHRNLYQVDIDELAEKVDNLCRTLVSIASELRRLRQ